MTSPKFKRFKTLTNTHDDRHRPIASVTPTTSAAAIPYLPDNIIERILSFSPIKLAARATAVSKHWASLWPSFPAIDFDEGDPSGSDDPAKFRRFLRFLENCLRRCQNQKSLDKFRLRIIHSVAGDDRVTVDKCVTFAIERCVKEFELCFVENEVSFYLMPQAVFSSHFLTSLKLEKVRINFRPRDRDNDPVILPSLKTMSLKEIDFDTDFDLQLLIDNRHVPCLEHLELSLCDLGFEGEFGYEGYLSITSYSLKSLEIKNCHHYEIEVFLCVNLETFMYVSDCTCDRHGGLTVWVCDYLKHLYIYGVGLKHLHILECPKTMENTIFSPSLEYFLFRGVVEAKLNFMESPRGLLDAEFRIQNYRWTSEYYSLLRDFLENFSCTGKVDITVLDAEGVIIPKDSRSEWSSPLPRVKQLQLTVAVPLREGDYRLDDLDPSLSWIAPSADILPHKHNRIVAPYEVQYDSPIPFQLSSLFFS